jgi:chromosomal replication initiator protein
MGTWDYSIFWKEAIAQIRDSIDQHEFQMWFNMEYDSSTESEVVVCVPSSFYKDQVVQRYQSMVEGKLQELSGSVIKVRFVVRTAKKEGAPEAGQEGAKEGGQRTEKPRTNAAAPQVAAEKKKKDPHQLLRQDYTFESFVIGENNAFAANAAMAIAKNPGQSYNPCLIYGGVGLGKTHLMQSIGNMIHEEFDGKKIIYITAENFTNEFIQSINSKQPQAFKNKYRYVDVLLIDDIHFFEKKDGTQEELFHTFNALYDANKQMVFTCDRPVSELKNLTDRLRSRFERGLNVDLQPPNYETRCAILQKKAETMGLSIPHDVIDVIAKNVSTNVRDLEAALTRLLAYAELVKKEITLDIAKQQLKDVFSSPKQSNVTMEIIQKVVAEYFALSFTDLRGKKRTQAVSFPRQLAMYIAREITEYSTTEVGLEFGGRDHTTVMHACQKIEEKIRSDPTMESTIQSLIRQIKEYSTKS